MPLPKPRDEKATVEFRSLPYSDYESTLAEPEKIIWASIMQLSAREFADRVLLHTHSIKTKEKRKDIAWNLKLFIQQAFEFYEAAQNAKSTTAPLLYYYSFLNLAKALSEIKYPRFYRRRENYNHGISWNPKKNYLVNIWNEKVNLTTRGVWHTLFEAITGCKCPARNPESIRMRDLFEFCPEISTEFERTFYDVTKLVDLVKPSIYTNEVKKIAWIGFSVSREDLRNSTLTKPKFIKMISKKGYKYRQVYSQEANLLKFELEHTKKYAKKDNLRLVLINEINDLNLFTSLGDKKIIYHITIQDRLPFRFPQLMVLYTLLFWLGSLVRYDPHSVADLKESQYWILIDGFMNQSRIWLLEQFEWYLYKTETTLVMGR